MISWQHLAYMLKYNSSTISWYVEHQFAANLQTRYQQHLSISKPANKTCQYYQIGDQFACMARNFSMQIAVIIWFVHSMNEGDKKYSWGRSTNRPRLQHGDQLNADHQSSVSVRPGISSIIISQLAKPLAIHTIFFSVTYSFSYWNSHLSDLS